MPAPSPTGRAYVRAQASSASGKYHQAAPKNAPTAMRIGRVSTVGTSAADRYVSSTFSANTRRAGRGCVRRKLRSSLR